MSTLHGIRTKCQNEHMMCREKATNGRTAPPGYHPPLQYLSSTCHPATHEKHRPCMLVFGFVSWGWHSNCIGSLRKSKQCSRTPSTKTRGLHFYKPAEGYHPQKRPQMNTEDHPAPPMVPTGQQLTTYLAVEWTVIQAIGSWLFAVRLLWNRPIRRRGEMKRGHPKRRSSAMSDARPAGLEARSFSGSVERVSRVVVRQWPSELTISQNKYGQYKHAC